MIPAVNPSNYYFIKLFKLATVASFVLNSVVSSVFSPAEDPAAAAPAAGCPDHCYQRSGSVPVVLAPDPAVHHQLTDPAADHPCLVPDPAVLVADLRQRILPQLLKFALIRPVPAACDRLPGCLSFRPL